MDGMEIDMELLRRIGVARGAAEELETGGDGDGLRQALAAARERMAEDFTFLRRLFTVVEEEIGSGEAPGPALGHAALAALEAAERYVVPADDVDPESLLREEAAAALAALGLDPADVEGAGSGAPSDEAREADDDVEGAPSAGSAGAGDDAPPVTLDDLALAAVRAADGCPDSLGELVELLARAPTDAFDLGPEGRALAEALDSGDEARVSDAFDRACTRIEDEALAAEMPPPAEPDDAPPAAPEPADEPAEPHEAAREIGDEADGLPASPATPDGAEPETGDAAPAADGGTDEADAEAAADGGNDPSDAPPTADVDLDLLRDFLDEAREHLEGAEAALLTLEENPGDAEAVNVVFRAFHTIKGVSGFLGLSRVSDLAHHAESLLSRVREGALAFTPAVADVTLRAADSLGGLLEGTRPLFDGRPAVEPGGVDELLAFLQDPDVEARLEAGEEAPRVSAAPALDSGGSSGRGAEPTGDSSVRVGTDRLDRLVDLVGELVVAQSMVAQDPALNGLDEDLTRKVARTGKILRELQDLSTSLRMVPLRGAFQKVARVVRDLGRRSGKSVRLVTEGEGTELDRQMVDALTDPLVHMVRNSVDHGIEDEEGRRAAGKEAEGEIRLAAYQAGGSVVIEISDDGRGLDRDRILAKARDRGLVESEHGLSDEDVFGLIFAAGFSTAREVTEISGRGVGMDVVRRAVESLRGRIDVRSEPGAGTRFVIHVPLTLAITEGMLLGVGRERYIVPIVKIHETFRPAPGDLTRVTGRGEVVSLHGRLVPMVRLGRVYGVPGAEEDPTRGLVVVVGNGNRRAALLVDAVLGQQHFVVKPLAGAVSDVPGVAGGTILGDGSVGLILEPEEIVAAAREAPAVEPAA